MRTYHQKTQQLALYLKDSEAKVRKLLNMADEVLGVNNQPNPIMVATVAQEAKGISSHGHVIPQEEHVIKYHTWNWIVYRRLFTSICKQMNICGKLV